MKVEERSKDTRVPRARVLRRDMTDAERKLWNALRAAPVAGTHFRRQATIGPYFADFACHQIKLVIEIDGGGHAEDARMSADAQRTAFLNSQGYRVLRFWNNDVLSNVEGVMVVIHQAISEQQRQGAPHP
jgi:very-short-patch-repair endonuclease